MTRKTYCGNLLLQSSLTLLPPVRHLLFVVIMPFASMASPIPHFSEGAAGRIKYDRGILEFDFGVDGTCLWVVSKDFKTNCYSLAGKEIKGPELDRVSPPLERLSWKIKTPTPTVNTVKLIRDGADRSQFPKLCEMELSSGLNVQAYPIGLPCFYMPVHFDIEGSPAYPWRNMNAPACSTYAVLCRTDFSLFRIELAIPCERFTLASDMKVSMSGTNCVVQFNDLDTEELFFHSGRIEKLGEDFKKKARCLTRSDMRRIVDDNRIFKLSCVFFLSESVVAIAPSSAEGRNTFTGRGYLVLYDFRTNSVFWSRRSDSEFWHWNHRVSVLWTDAVLSADERHLAVLSGGVIYLYKDFRGTTRSGIM